MTDPGQPTQPVSREPLKLRWHFGPTKDDPEPGKLWHEEPCGGEVWFIGDGLICRKCGQQQDAEVEP